MHNAVRQYLSVELTEDSIPEGCVQKKRQTGDQTKKWCLLISDRF